MAVQGCHSFESNDDAGLPHRVSACEFRHLAAAFSIYPLRGPLKTLPGLPVATRLLSRVGWRHPYFFLLALYLFHRRLAAEHGRNARAWPKAALSQRTRPPSRRHLGTRTASYNHFFPPFFFVFFKMEYTNDDELRRGMTIDRSWLVSPSLFFCEHGHHHSRSCRRLLTWSSQLVLTIPFARPLHHLRYRQK